MDDLGECWQWKQKTRRVGMEFRSLWGKSMSKKVGLRIPTHSFLGNLSILQRNEIFPEGIPVFPVGIWSGLPQK